MAEGVIRKQLQKIRVAEPSAQTEFQKEALGINV
jgi:hypothetical protein